MHDQPLLQTLRQLVERHSALGYLSPAAYNVPPFINMHTSHNVQRETLS
jgi:hypothetical protein